MPCAWPLNRPIDSPDDALQAEVSLPLWTRLAQQGPSGLAQVHQGSPPVATQLPAILDDRRVELLAHRLARSYEQLLATCAPSDHALLSWVIGPRLKAVPRSEGEGWSIDHSVWRFNARYDGVPEGKMPALRALFNAAWFPAQGPSLFAGFEPVLAHRYVHGVDCELGSWEESVWSVLTSIHVARRHAQRQRWNAAGRSPLLDEGLFDQEISACLALA